MTGPRAGGAGPPSRLLFIAPNPSIDRLYELDRLVAGEIHRPESMVAVPGGKGLNAARAAVTLGGSVTAVAIVGGRAGDWIVEQLAQLGIDTRAVRASGETRSCVSVLDRSTGKLTEIYEHGTPVEDAVWDELGAVVRRELQAADVAAIALSGSLPSGAPADSFGRLARIAATAARPVPILVDAHGPALVAALSERPAIVKLNAAEAGEASAIAVSDAASAADAGGAILGAGATCVIVTLGLAGAVVVREGERAHLVPPDVRGAYPVGSGDAFLGALAVAMARGEPVVEAARLGVAAGIANAQVQGAGRLDPAAIESLLDRITVSPI